MILINVDTLRADHLGCYGYSRNTSPFIDRIASEGALFGNALSNSSFTRESVTVLLTGRLPTSGGSIGWSATPSPKIETLSELFRAAGYRTGFFSNTTALTHEAFTRGSEEVQHLPDRWGLSRMGRKLSERAIEFVEEHRDEKFLLYLHYLDPHGPYDPPRDKYRRFAKRVYPDPVSLYGKVRSEFNDLV